MFWWFYTISKAYGKLKSCYEWPKARTIPRSLKDEAVLIPQDVYNMIQYSELSIT